MNRLAKINCIFLLLFFSNMKVSAQINVFSTNCISPAVTAFGNATSFSKGCYVFPNTNGDIYGATGAKEVVAAEYILLEDDVAFSTTSSGQTDLRIEAAPFEVVAFTNDLQNIDVISSNEYNFFTSEVHGFYKNIISKVVNDYGNAYPLNGYNKPIIFSESGANKVWKCENFVETRRNIWQNMFFGVAGAFDWNIEELRADDPTKDYSIYSRVAEFFQGVDLEGDNWHSGIVKLDNNNNWEYKASYRNDCIREDELADLVYLRSGDKRKAFGVITNRRANYFTLGGGECVDTTVALPEHSEYDPQEEDDFADYTDSLRSYGAVSPGSGSDKLQLRNMKSNLYSINYYSPHNLSSPIGAEIAIGPILNLDFPTMDTLDIMLFTAQRSNINFKSGFLDTVFTEETIQREDNNEQEDDVIVYPNPNDGQFVVMLEKPNDVQVILIKNSLGKLIDSRKEVFRENKYDVHGFAAGVYAVEVVYADKIVRKKMVIN